MPPRSSRSAKIGIGIAAGSIIVIIVSLMTLGGGKGPGPRRADQRPDPGRHAAPRQAPATGQPATEPGPEFLAVAQPTSPARCQFGDTGASVKWLQSRLHQLGMYSGPISGRFDQATVVAVTQFQQRAHPADPAGVVGRSTKTALIAWGSRPRLALAAGSAATSTPRPTRRTSSGLQRALASALSQNMRATGTFDAATFAAVVAYQSSVGLPPDGVVGDQVWAALQSGKLPG